MEEKRKVKNGIQYQIGYQLLWHFAFDPMAMPKELIQAIKNTLSKICSNYQYEVIELNIIEDRVEIRISCPYTVAPVDAMKTLRSFSAMELIQQYPEIRKFYVKHGMIWKRGCELTTFDVTAK